jgi:Icc-related predicted phosphoesterase
MGTHGNLKLIVAADMHGKRQAYEKTFQKTKEAQADAIIICGDLTHFGSVQQARELLSILTVSQMPVLYVPGNLDPQELANAKIEGTACIHASCESINGHSFVGVGALHPAFRTPENKIMQWLEDGFDKCSQKQNLILVSHVPPKNTKVDMAYIGGHAGSLCIRQFVSEHKPIAVFCGHIHEGRGLDNIGDSVIVNPGAGRSGYYALVELGRTVDVELGRF